MHEKTKKKNKARLLASKTSFQEFVQIFVKEVSLVELFIWGQKKPRNMCSLCSRKCMKISLITLGKGTSVGPLWSCSFLCSCLTFFYGSDCVQHLAPPTCVPPIGVLKLTDPLLKNSRESEKTLLPLLGKHFPGKFWWNHAEVFPG